MNATFVFLAGLVIKGSMVLLLGFVAARCLRAVSAACRSLAWLAVFAVMAVLPVGGFVDPVWSLPVVKVTRTAPVVMPANESQAPSLQTNADIFTARPVEDAHAAVRWDARFVCFAGYFAGVIALLASRLMGSWQLRDIRRSGRRAEEKIEKLVRQLAAERGVTRSVSVLISDRISVPMTWGMARPVIALP